MKHQVTVKIVLDTRREKVSGKFRVKLRVTYQRVQKYYPVLTKDKQPFDLTTEEFEKVFSMKPRGEHKDSRDLFDEIVAEAKETITDLTVFSFPQFEAKFLKSTPDSTSDVGLAFENAIQEMIRGERISTAEGYRACLKALNGMAAKLQFADITPSFLSSFQFHLEGSGKSINTIAIYMRYLRSIFNDAISSGVIDRKYYPFGREKTKYQIQTGSKNPKALSLEVVRHIFEYEPESEDERKARDFWVFSYLSNGMNPKDIAGLRYCDIDFKEEKISFYRGKTSARVKNLEKIEVTLLPELKEIVERYGVKPIISENYVFPIFNSSMNAKQRKLAKDVFIQFMNRHTKRIGQKLGVNNLTSIVARHSFATVLVRSGVSTEFISESLGHTNLKTTANYLARFEDGTKRKNAQLLTNFKNESEK